MTGLKKPFDTGEFYDPYCRMICFSLNIWAFFGFTLQKRYCKSENDNDRSTSFDRSLSFFWRQFLGRLCFRTPIQPDLKESARNMEKDACFDKISGWGALNTHCCMLVCFLSTAFFTRRNSVKTPGNCTTFRPCSVPRTQPCGTSPAPSGPQNEDSPAPC